MKAMLIGFGHTGFVEADHHRRQRLIELQCEHTGQTQAQAEEALLAMSPSERAHVELTGARGHVIRDLNEDYDVNEW